MLHWYDFFTNDLRSWSNQDFYKKKTKIILYRTLVKAVNLSSCYIEEVVFLVVSLIMGGNRDKITVFVNFNFIFL